ncbi:unnamed protein product [Rangifer tarandus platyrhynchus]|uniref:Uncharacterized protein n=2 Tax=Rangifer tarandus platyrhynchus TaxID=3082113 RepID=A0ACB0DZ54_RANTA|nr:unnamed protein product [Rangifer tarandus platyrhynchus]CAI9693351.1 unnamed protein product [Rangifer tarandus platyrhynchus]
MFKFFVFISEQCRRARGARPPQIHTPAYCCAPRGHGRRGAPTARSRSLSHSANTQPNFGPAVQPLASRVEGKRERGGQRQRRAGTLYPPGGAAAPLQLLAGREGSGRARGQPGKLAAGEPGGVEREDTPRGERGALDRVGGQDGLEARDSRQTQDSAGIRDVGGSRGGARCRSRGWKGRTSPRVREGGRPGVLGARGGVPGGQERGSLPANVQEGSAWRSSLGLRALDPKRQMRGGVVRCNVGETRGRVIAGKSKWRVKLVRLPGGGEQAGECGQEHEAGQENRGGREAVGT